MPLPVCGEAGSSCVAVADVSRERLRRRGRRRNLRAQLDRFSHLLEGGTAASRRKRAIATLTGMIGALMLARAVEDPALSEEILAAARDAFGEGAAIKSER